MAVCDVVVIGNYPPQPGPATASTVAAVRRAWDADLSVKVVSFRPGAAHMTVPVVGVLAGRRLEQVRQHLGSPPQLVFSLQRGAPFTGASWREQWATATGLAVAMRQFQRVTLLLGEDPMVDPMSMFLLVRSADHVSIASEGLASELSRRYRALRSAVVEEVPSYPHLPAGVDPRDAGLYAPGKERDIAVAWVPGASIAQIAKAKLAERRARLPRPFAAR